MTGPTANPAPLPILYILLQLLPSSTSALSIPEDFSPDSFALGHIRQFIDLEAGSESISISQFSGLSFIFLGVAILSLCHYLYKHRFSRIAPEEKPTSNPTEDKPEMDWQEKEYQGAKYRESDSRWDPRQYTSEKGMTQEHEGRVGHGQRGYYDGVEQTNNALSPPSPAFSSRPSSQRSRQPPPPIDLNYHRTGVLPLVPGPPAPLETHDFGENPQYHDDNYQYISPASASTPPSPFSSKYYSAGIRKIKSHNRSPSSPKLVQSVQRAALEQRSSMAPNPQFPLPTLRPITPPETMSTPGSPVVAHNQEEDLGRMSLYEYSRHYPQPQGYHDYDRHASHCHDYYDYQHQHRRAQSVPLAITNTGPSPINCEASALGQEGSERGWDGQSGAEFRPVMVYEQGRSLTGQKWRRKVTVFRSEVLEKLEKEGLIVC